MTWQQDISNKLSSILENVLTKQRVFQEEQDSNEDERAEFDPDAEDAIEPDEINNQDEIDRLENIANYIQAAIDKLTEE